MNQKIVGRRYTGLIKKIEIIKNQIEIGQLNDYPFDSELLEKHLDMAIEGRFFTFPNSPDPWKKIIIGDTSIINQNKMWSKSAVAEKMIRKMDFLFSISPVVQEIKLRVETTEEILGDSGTLLDIYAGINKRGGGLLAAESAVSLRIQYPDQPKGECLFVAMTPIEVSNAYHIFRLLRGNNDLNLGCRSWLHNQSVSPESNFSRNKKWVFRSLS